MYSTLTRRPHDSIYDESFPGWKLQRQCLGVKSRHGIFPERVKIGIYPSLIATRSFQPPRLQENNGGMTFSMTFIFLLFGGKLIDLSGVNTIHPSQPTTRAGHAPPTTSITDGRDGIRHHGPDLPPGGPPGLFAPCRHPQALRVSNFVTLRPDQW